MKKYQHPELSNVPLTAVMHALSDPCRINIMLQLLSNSEMACAAFELSVSKSTASHHFEVLRSSGLIRTRTEGVKCLNSARIEEINQYFPGVIGLIKGSK